MTEIQVIALVYATTETLESTELMLPIPMLMVSDLSALDKKISSSPKPRVPDTKRYFVLLFEPIETDADNLYAKMEENPQILYIFNIWHNNQSIPSFPKTKLHYISRAHLNVFLTLALSQFLKDEANKQLQLKETSLSKIYLRKAEKSKEWLMSNLRAEPCHILVIPLNTDSINLNNTIQRLQQYCAQIGYPSAVVRPLDDFIPKSGIYDKLPYGKLLFEYEDPETICRWLRSLSPIRMYLYGNEQIIPNEWSKQMIASEVDHVGQNIFNDDNWYTFLENESVHDNIKWTFSSKHGGKWKVTQLAPIKIDTLIKNIRFRSALRRSNMTFHSRISTVTTEIFSWFDECVFHNYIAPQSIRQGITASNETGKAARSAAHTDTFYAPSENPLFLPTHKEVTYSDPPPFDQTNEIANYYSNQSNRTYIWLDSDLYTLEQRFHQLIYPNHWRQFSSVFECQASILKEQIQYARQIYICVSHTLAEQLFIYEHLSRISAVYAFSNRNEIHSKWIYQYPSIRGMFQNFDLLYEQLHSDIIMNVDLVPFPSEEQEDKVPLAVSFLRTDPDGFKRHRVLIDILLSLPVTSETKQEMIDELRRTSTDNRITLEQIDDFEQNYHPNGAIEWYTRDSFLFRSINKALRYDDFETILIYRLIIVDLYQALEHLHQQILSERIEEEPSLLTFYRGQRMSTAGLNQFKENVGGILSFNTFISTTASLDIAYAFAGGSIDADVTSSRSVIFSIETNSHLLNTRPYATVSSYSLYEHEDEVLFTPGLVFRVEKVDELSINDPIQVIHLTLIDEDILPAEMKSIDISKFVLDEELPNSIYALVGLTSLFQVNEQYEHVKSILEEVHVLFFDNTDDFDHYVRSLETTQSFVIFINKELHSPERSDRRNVFVFDENDMHCNDLIYQLLYQIKHHQRGEEDIRDLYNNIAKAQHSSSSNPSYVQLLLSPTSRKNSEERLKTKLPSASIITFYQTESCIDFLRSIVDPLAQIGNVTVILQFDDAHVNSLIDQLEQINSIKNIYICSTNALKVPNRRVIYGRFQDENSLYSQLYSDNIFSSLAQVNERMDSNNNKDEAQRCFKQAEQFCELLKDYQTNILD